MYCFMDSLIKVPTFSLPSFSVNEESNVVLVVTSRGHNTTFLKREKHSLAASGSLNTLAKEIVSNDNERNRTLEPSAFGEIFPGTKKHPFYQ